MNNEQIGEFAEPSDLVSGIWPPFNFSDNLFFNNAITQMVASQRYQIYCILSVALSDSKSHIFVPNGCKNYRNRIVYHRSIRSIQIKYK